MVSTTVEPISMSRLGLRYVNQIVDENVRAPHDWEGSINPALLGPVLDSALWPPIVASQNQFELDIANDDRCTIRHGFINNPSIQPVSVYLLDIDTYRNDVAPFNSTDILQLADKFNAEVWQVFKRSLMPELYFRLKGESDG